MKKNDYLRKLYDEGKIIILSPDLEFDPDYQIEPDAINLRLHPKIMKFRNDLQRIDPLDSPKKVQNYFEPLVIPKDGLTLKPNELVFAKTLETILINSEQHIGLVFGRRTIAGFGISINFNQPKFPVGLPWNFPLQIVNNTNFELIIYPFMYIAQLIIIEYPASAKRKYKGIYYGRIDNFLPTIDQPEQNRILDMLKKIKDNQLLEINNESKIKNLLVNIENKRRTNRFFEKWGKRILNILGEILIYLIIAVLGAVIYSDIKAGNISYLLYIITLIILILPIYLKLKF